MYPIGSIVKVEKNSENRLAIVTSIYPKRLNEYGFLLILDDKGKYRNIQGESIYYGSASSIKELHNAWALSKEQTASLIHGSGINSEGLWKKMEEDLKDPISEKKK